MKEINILSAEYVLDIDGNVSCVKAETQERTYLVPLDPANRHYAEIMRQVEAGTLTVQEAQ